MSGSPTRKSAVWPYVQIARPDHWFKNAFMVLGVILACFYRPDAMAPDSFLALAIAVIATCLVASSNYVLNELLDAPLDRLHPLKKNRPAARGDIRTGLALTEWIVLGSLGVGLAWTVNGSLALSAAALWVMGCIYNVRPLRSKDVPYVDVLSESVNNPIRLALGWHALISDQVPPVSLMLAYWMAGAFFMATKRFAEYRQIGDPTVAAAYRRSFAHYNEDRLLVSVVFYLTNCALFAGIFIVRYKLELILSVPLLAGFFAYYLKLGLRESSPTQNPEKLIREPVFLGLVLLVTASFLVLMLVDIPVLYRLFNVDGSSLPTLWTVGSN